MCVCLRKRERKKERGREVVEISASYDSQINSKNTPYKLWHGRNKDISNHSLSCLNIYRLLFNVSKLVPFVFDIFWKHASHLSKTKDFQTSFLIKQAKDRSLTRMNQLTGNVVPTPGQLCFTAFVGL